MAGSPSTVSPPTATLPTVTPLTADDAPAVVEVDQWAFGHPVDERDRDGMAAMLDWDRVFGAFVDTPARRLAGVYGAYSVDCPVPGGTRVPAAGLTWVGVHPRDRRRGVLTAMIDHHLDDVRGRRGEPLSLLFAAEPAIYGRFGYGLASRGARLTLPRGAALRDVPGTDDLVVDLEHADAGRHAPAVSACFAAAEGGRPGWVTRTARHTSTHLFFDPPHRRNEIENLRLMTVSDPDGTIRGYAAFRRKTGWESGSPNGTVLVREVITVDPAAARALWGRLLDLDLTTSVETPPLAVDDPLLHLLVDVRAAVPRLSDGVWARLVDVPAALATRRYATAVDAVLEVRDPRRPGGGDHWHLRGDRSFAECVATDRPAALTLDVRELGSAYLGGVTLSALAASGLVDVHDPEVLAVAATAFLSPVAPWCPWQF